MRLIIPVGRHCGWSFITWKMRGAAFPPAQLCSAIAPSVERSPTIHMCFLQHADGNKYQLPFPLTAASTAARRRALLLPPGIFVVMMIHLLHCRPSRGTVSVLPLPHDGPLLS